MWPKMVSLQTSRKPYRDVPSLLAADSEEEPSSEEESDLEDNRPSLLPLDEVIRAVPSTLSSLLEVIVPRLQQRSGVKGLSPDDQQSFVSILVGELSGQFSSLKQQIDDPFLSPQKNRALHRLVAVQVCRILEDLYGQYIAKATRLSDDGVLSVAAHMTRLRAQLAIQASRSINLPAIRRQVLSQLRGPLPTNRSSRLPRVPQWQPPHRAREITDLSTLNLGAPLSSKLSWLAPSGSAVMRTRRVQKLRAGMTQQQPHTAMTIGATQVVSDSEADVMNEEEQSVTLDPSPEQPELQRAPSMPELYGNFLLCDWKLLNRAPYHIPSPTDHRRERRHEALSTGRRASIGSNIAHDHLKWTSEETKVEKRLGDYTQDDLTSDLHQLSEMEPSFIHSLSQDDIDPLLQACGHGLSRKQKSRLAAHDQLVRRKQEEEERQRREEEEERRQRERGAVATLEDMERMQYLREQTPQSLSLSHASLHMRSNASDYQTHSQTTSSQLQYNRSADLDVSAPDVVVDRWSDVDAKASSSQACSVSHASLSLSGSGWSEAHPSQSETSTSLRQSSHHIDQMPEHTSLVSSTRGLIPDPVSQHSSTGGLIPEPASQHSSTGGLIPDPVSQHSSTGGLIPEPASQHSSTGGLIPEPASQHSSTGGLIPEPASQHSSTGGLIPDSMSGFIPDAVSRCTSTNPVSQHSATSSLISNPVSQHSSTSSLISNPVSQHSSATGLVILDPFSQQSSKSDIISDPISQHTSTTASQHSGLILDPASQHSGLILDPVSQHSGLILDPASYHSSTTDFIPDPASQQSSARGLIPDPILQHTSTTDFIPDPASQHSGLIPDPGSQHSSTSTLILDPVSKHSSSCLISEPVSQSTSTSGPISHHASTNNLLPDPLSQNVPPSGLIPKPVSHHSSTHGRIPDPISISGLILDPVSQHSTTSGLILDPVSQHASTSGLIPDPVSQHSSTHALILDPEHSSTNGLIPEPVSHHASTSGLIPDPVSQQSSISHHGHQSSPKTLSLDSISQCSSRPNLGSVSLTPDTATHSVPDGSIRSEPRLPHSHSSPPTSRLYSNADLLVERSRPLAGSSGNLQLALDSPLPGGGVSGGDVAGSSQSTPRGGGLGEGVGQAAGAVSGGDVCGDVCSGVTSEGEGQGGVSLSDSKSFSMATFSDPGTHEEGEVTNERPEEQDPQPQPAVITTRIHDKVIRSSDLCVSERKLLTTLRLKPYKPIWNELTGELDHKTVDELDSNLTEGQEMDILYHELMKTIPKDYLDMESDPSLIPAIQEAVDLPSVVASSSLPHRPSRRVVNPDLCPVSETPPWGDKSKRDEWKKSNLYTGPDPNELMAPKGSALTPAQARLRQQYKNWLKWWKATVSPEDYLKFVAQRETDYLHHVYHLYDSEGSESEDEEEKERRERLLRLHSKLQAKQARCAEQYRSKNQYQRGMWNVNTVLMGGLGEDPDSSGSASEEDIEGQFQQQNGKEPEEGMQQRLQAVWSILHLSHQQRIEMTIKYCSHQFKQQARKAITLWERVCKMIEEREHMLGQLLSFEKAASDPGRLFARGGDATRLQESKRRKQLHLALDNLDRKLSRTLHKLKTRYGDVVTYKGRPYHEKMRRDRTELLYLLQQQRRTDFLTHHYKPTCVNVSSPTLGRKL